MIAGSEYRHKSWHNRMWGAKALAAAGKPAEAIRYAEDSKGLNAPLAAVAAFCEGVLLDAGFADGAYARYAVEATYATTNLATFKAIVRKYPHMTRETILRDLVASQPGNEGKWFGAAKDAGFSELAIELANRSPSDPRTLISAPGTMRRNGRSLLWQPVCRRFEASPTDMVSTSPASTRWTRTRPACRRPLQRASARLWSMLMCERLLHPAGAGASLLGGCWRGS